ncbi:MAG: HAD family phosphatase [Peptostreptococcaceae bacterium]|nr:HAD family phosphatase [Peptostreptococcaceae bacterium]
MSIKLIGLDLDGTTLNKREKVDEETKQALEESIRRGIHVVFATGRSYYSLPSDVFAVKGVEYIITSNGAHITRLKDSAVIYSNCIKAGSSDKILDIVVRHKVHVEAFIEGVAYIDRKEYENLKENGSTYRSIDYVIRTRKPVDDIFQHMKNNENKIENINLLFEDSEKRRFIRKLLETVPGITLTTSFANNLEVGGATTNKGVALSYLMELLNLKSHNLMCFGDNQNDITMIELAKIGVAMGNADILVKETANYITEDNNNNGVANAINKLVLK